MPAARLGWPLALTKVGGTVTDRAGVWNLRRVDSCKCRRSIRVMKSVHWGLLAHHAGRRDLLQMRNLKFANILLLVICEVGSHIDRK